eukprot:4463819-Prymnesium_polylepis.2
MPAAMYGDDGPTPAVVGACATPTFDARWLSITACRTPCAVMLQMLAYPPLNPQWALSCSQAHVSPHLVSRRRHHGPQASLAAV